MPDEPETPACSPSSSSPRPASRLGSAPTARPCCSKTRTGAAGTAPPSAAAARRWSLPAGSDAGSGYGLQASIAECHAVAPSVEETDWERIVLLYDALASLAPSPIVDLNRAVAVSMARGPDAALPLVDGLVESGNLTGSHLLPGVRGEPLTRLGRNLRGPRGAGGRRTPVRERARARGSPEKLESLSEADGVPPTGAGG